MNDENPYESPQTTNDAAPSDKIRTVKTLTKMAAISEGIGVGVVAYAVLGMTKHATPISIFFLGALLIIVGIVFAMTAVVVWFLSKPPMGPLEKEMREKFGPTRGEKNSP